MASSRTSEREEERRINLRTLVIASSASASAAVVTSQLWIAGTWIAAAVTPVMVALISELLNRPTEKIADRLTSDGPVLRPRRDGRDPPQPDTAEPPPPPPSAPTSPPSPSPSDAAPVRVYRSGSPAPRRRKIAVGAVLGTGALALLIAVVALTVPELVAGGSIGNSSGGTTFFSRDRNRSTSDQDKQRDKDKQTVPSDTGEKSTPATETATERSTEEPQTTEPTTESTPTATAPAGATSAEPAPTPAPGEQP